MKPRTDDNPRVFNVLRVHILDSETLGGKDDSLGSGQVNSNNVHTVFREGALLASNEACGENTRASH